MMMDMIEEMERILSSERDAIEQVRHGLAAQRSDVEAVCRLILESCGPGSGRLICTGMGKAGIIAHKLAATFASTGTPAHFLHPAEALHGDLGMVDAQDVVLALSNSGSSDELIALVPALAHIGARLVALVGEAESPLARAAQLVIAMGPVAEACPLRLAPSSSTTALLALGDALALAVQGLRNFAPEDYARFHPAGALGRKLLTCAEAMRSGERVSQVHGAVPIGDVLHAMTASRSGCALLVDSDGQLQGIFTDGDLRRVLENAENPAEILTAPVETAATRPCRHTVHTSDLLQVALHRCSEYKINALPVLDEAGLVAGLIDLQDLSDRGFTASA
jgi:arabinose-5-phosphate isomerase